MTYQQVLHHEHIARQQRFFAPERRVRPVEPALPAHLPAEFKRDWLNVASLEFSKRILASEIIKAVAIYYDTSAADLVSFRRTAAAVRHRHVAIYLARHLTLLSLAEIGRRVGDRDHTTILHAIRKIEADIKAEPELAQEIENIKRLLMFNTLAATSDSHRPYREGR